MISKRTVNEFLEEYLKGKEIDKDIRNKIMESLHSDINKKIKGQKEKEKKEEQRERKKVRVSHGTSCPRVTSLQGDLLVEL